MIDRKKYPGYNANDTFWDEHHRSQGLMTNREFFTSNAKGGFYEGMEWDEELKDWVPNAETKARREAEENKDMCKECGIYYLYCECTHSSDDEE
jgi:hypothetical protein